MTFYTASHSALREADEERLRRLAAMGDKDAARELEYLSQRRGESYDWQEIARRWTSPSLRLYANAGAASLNVAEPYETPLAYVQAAPRHGSMRVSIIIFAQTLEGEDTIELPSYLIETVKNDYTGGTNRIVRYFGEPHMPYLQWGNDQRLRKFFALLEKDARSTELGVGRTPIRRSEQAFYQTFDQYLPL